MTNCGGERQVTSAAAHLCVTVDVAVVRDEVLLWVVVVPEAGRDLLGRAERSPRLESSQARVQSHEQRPLEDPVLKGKLRTSLLSRLFLPFLPLVYQISFDRRGKKMSSRTGKKALVAKSINKQPDRIRLAGFPRNIIKLQRKHPNCFIVGSTVLHLGIHQSHYSSIKRAPPAQSAQKTPQRNHKHTIELTRKDASTPAVPAFKTSVQNYIREDTPDTLQTTDLGDDVRRVHHPEHLPLVVLNHELSKVVVAGQGPCPGNHTPHVGVDQIRRVEAHGEGEPLGAVRRLAARVGQGVGENGGEAAAWGGGGRDVLGD